MKGVVLAAGRGSRMRAGGGGVRGGSGGQASAGGDPLLHPEQRTAADRGLKPLVPFHGHPFLSYVLTELADAGIEEVCLVVGPDHDPVRTFYAGMPTERVRIRFAVQERPEGSADALLAAEDFAGSDPVLVVNADNLYPSSVVVRLARTPSHALAGFRPDDLARSGIDRERIRAFAVAIADERGCLRSIREKPTEERLAEAGVEPFVSMNCWRFEPAIFRACRGVRPSERGEKELPDAVTAMVGEGVCVRLVPARGGVLDLTRRGDIPTVERRLRRRRVRL